MGLGNRVKVWRLSIILLFALQEMCSPPRLCEPSGGRWEKVWGKKWNNCESFLGFFGMDLYLSESLGQQSQPGPLASALCLCVCQYEFCFNY